MLFIKELTVIFVVCLATTNAEVPERFRHHSHLSEEMHKLKTKHHEEMEAIKSEMAKIKDEVKAHCAVHTVCHNSNTIIEERNDKPASESTKKTIGELRMQMNKLTKKVDSSDLLKQLQQLNNNMNHIVTENGYRQSLARTLEARMDKLDDLVQRLHYDKKNLENMIGELRLQLSSVSKQVKHKLLELEEEGVASNTVIGSKTISLRHRHNKAVHSQLTRLMQAQEQLEAGHQSIQVQLLGHQKRLEHLEESNWDLISAKVDILEIQGNSLHDRLGNTTAFEVDVEKMHSSILELREDLESVENKMDKTMPEFRKEISKLDVDQAQMNAHFSYIKQDQENLRQSVKAIAVSMSNTQDRAAENHEGVQNIVCDLNELKLEIKQHFHKLNDHILKSEANVAALDNNLTDTISLPELMGEVKELQSVDREYQNLVAQLPKDCSNVTEPVGSYIIRTGNLETTNVWCSNGTTLIQRRYNGSTEFNRKYAEYVRGFGDVGGEYWLGLEIMHRITRDNCTSMRIDMTDIYGAGWFAQYEIFIVGSSETGYTLNVGGFTGNASDAFEYQNHMQFSAIDRDRDISNAHCAANYEGGWWFSHCQHVNINGRYNLGLTWFDSSQNEWIAVATTEMRMFRRSGCN